MYLAYLQERYLPEDFAPLTREQVAEAFEHIQADIGAYIYKSPKGFMTYKPVGDAVIIHDMYVIPSARRSYEARQMFDALTDVGRKSNKKVVITFSEEIGRNREFGLKAIESVGFVPAYSLDKAQMYIRGI